MLSVAQVGEHQLPSRESAVFDFPIHQLITIADRTQFDLKRECLIVQQAAAQKFEAVADGDRLQAQ